MKLMLSACTVAFVVLCSLAFAGCSAGDGTDTTYLTMIAQTTVNGVTQDLSDATFVAMAEPGSYGCVPGSDTSCVVNVDTVASTGVYTLNTDALPATWVVSVQPTTNCSAGGSSGAVEVGTDATVTVNCGVNDGGLVTASPSGCVREWDSATNAFLVNTCPSGFAVTLTTSGSTFPTDHAMAINQYTPTGSSVNSQWTVTASSATSITLTPTTLYNGQNIITITDPRTNVTIGAALYTYNYSVYSGTGPR